jgi:hypothetical protein
LSSQGLKIFGETSKSYATIECKNCWW